MYVCFEVMQLLFCNPIAMLIVAPLLFLLAKFGVLRFSPTVSCWPQELRNSHLNAGPFVVEIGNSVPAYRT